MSAASRSFLLIGGYTVAYFLLSLSIAVYLIDPLLPSPYMDEIFHLSQSQTYCQGRFKEWNSKITTFPGLYLTTLPYAWIWTQVEKMTTGLVLKEDEMMRCTPFILRSINLLYGTLTIPIFYLLLRKLMFQLHTNTLLLVTIQFSLFPLSFFFNFLYYTDNGSLFWLLFTYLAHLQGWRVFEMLLGLMAVGMRQTNIVWIGFMLLTDIVQAWTRNDRELFGEVREIPSSSSSSSSINASSQFDDDEKVSKLTSRQLYQPDSWFQVPRTIFRLIGSCLFRLPALVRYYLGPIFICLTFVAFFFYNDKSIVIGDKTHHALSLHLPQVPYFLTMTVGWTILNTFEIQRLRNVLGDMWKNKLGTILLAMAFTVAVHYFTIAHPFLLADNRHYPFYVWKNFFVRWNWFRYAMIPIYVISIFWFQTCWSSMISQLRLFQGVYWLVVTMSLILTPLIELRYFTTPFVIWYLHSMPKLNGGGGGDDRSSIRSILSILLYVLINVVTIWIFLYKPFTWPDGSEARFMW